VDSFDLCSCNQYFLVRMIPSCLKKMCLCQVILSRRCTRCFTSFNWGSYTLFIWTGGHVCLSAENVTWIDLDLLPIILHFLNQFWIASRLVCSFCEAMAGSLSVDSTAVSSAKFAVVDSG
jgi:hypothetical protein